MIYLKWLALMPVSALFAVVGIVAAPILPFFVRKDTHRLPDWLAWFRTPDSDADGDAKHWMRWPGLGKWATYKRRVAWLWRNKGYGFDINVLGAKVRSSDDWIVKGDENASDTNGISGYCIRHVWRDGKHLAFQVYYIKHYTLIGRHACLRINLGWKLWGSRDYPKQYVGIFFNPLMCFKLWN